MLSSAPGSPTGTYNGSVELTLASRNGRTRLVQSRTRPPLQVQQALYPDPALPHLAMVMLSNPTGGIFQGDHHRIGVNVEPGAAAHVTGQGAARIHAMPQGMARQDVDLVVAEGGYLEYLPDPVIPYRDSDFEQRATLTVASGSKLIYWDIITPGRVAMDESFRYRRLFSRLDVMDCSRRPAYHEAFTLNPSKGLPLARRASSSRQGEAPGCTLGSMLVITGDQGAQALLSDLQEVLPTMPGVAAGATLLPNRLGVGIRVLGDEAPEVREALTQCWAAARQRLLGCGIPFLRKY